MQSWHESIESGVNSNLISYTAKRIHCQANFFLVLLVHPPERVEGVYGVIMNHSAGINCRVYSASKLCGWRILTALRAPAAYIRCGCVGD